MGDINYRIKDFVSEFDGKPAHILLYVADFVGNGIHSLLIVYGRDSKTSEIFGFFA